MCGLYEISKRHLEQSGFSAEEAIEAVAPLARANLENILAKGPALALSGPVERNDADTVKKHLSFLPDQREKQIYTKLSYVLTQLAKKKHPENDYTNICQLLDL